MTFGSGGASETGELFSVSRLSVLATEPPGREPHIDDEFHAHLDIEGSPRKHILVMSRALLEDFVKQARATLDDQG